MIKTYIIEVDVDEDLIETTFNDKNITKIIKKEIFEYTDLIGIYIKDVKKEEK